MKKIVKIASGILSLIFASAAFATDSSNIPLKIPGDGSIKRMQTIMVSLDPLPVSTSPSFFPYDILCTIKNNYYQDPSPVYMNFGFGGSIGSYWYTFLNGVSIGASAPLSKETVVNDYKAVRVTTTAAGAWLSFTNLDQDHDVALVECHGVPNTDKNA
jgi:hypothetical protein